MTHTTAPRLQLEGAINVRDLGGIATTTGQRLVSGRLLRADALSKLTDSDLDLLAALGLRTVIDFRSDSEIASAGQDRLPAGATGIALPIEAGDLDAFVQALTSGDLSRQVELLGDGRAARFLTEINRQFVADDTYRAQFGRALHLIASADSQPLLYHCTAGKDRTGWMTAIVLTAVGVPRDVVLADYLASNEYVWPAYRPLIEAVAEAGQLRDPDLVRPLLVQDPAYLEAAFDEVESRYGGFAAFLAEGLDFSPDDTRRLRAGLLG